MEPGPYRKGFSLRFFSLTPLIKLPAVHRTDTVTGKKKNQKTIAYFAYIYPSACV